MEAPPSTLKHVRLCRLVPTRADLLVYPLYEVDSS